jgi:hypothetical protein
MYRFILCAAAALSACSLATLPAAADDRETCLVWPKVKESTRPAAV